MRMFGKRHAMLRGCASALGTLLLVSGGMVARANDCEQTAKVNEIADGVYVRQGEHGTPFVDQNFANMGFIVGDECVAVIDSGASPAEGEAMKCAIAATTSVPVCYLIVTHYHFDHALGSLPFKADDDGNSVELIGHAKLGRALAGSAEYYIEQITANSAIELGKEHFVEPDRVVSVGEPLTLALGGRTLTLSAHAPAHTDNDVSVFDDKTETLWLSDLLFVEHVPTLDVSLGDSGGWLDTLSELKAKKAARAVPGHGPVSVDWPSGALDIERYFKTLRDEIRAMIQAGETLQHAQENAGLAESERWKMFDFHHKRTIVNIFTELEWE